MDETSVYYRDIISKIGAPALLEQLAEEGAEISHAALKLARVLRQENPTPVTRDEAIRHLEEEVADIRLCLDIVDEAMGGFDTLLLEREKYQRWRQRIAEAENEARSVLNPSYSIPT